MASFEARKKSRSTSTGSAWLGDARIANPNADGTEAGTDVTIGDSMKLGRSHSVISYGRPTTEFRLSHREKEASQIAS